MSIRRSLALLCMMCGALAAQEFRATLSGIVTDPSGAAIPGANVKATNTANNQAREVKTNGAGLYAVPYLDPGVYTVEVTASGFTTVKRQEITLSVSQELNLPIQMQLGSTSTEVT